MRYPAKAKLLQKEFHFFAHLDAVNTELLLQHMLQNRNKQHLLIALHIKTMKRRRIIIANGG